MRRQPEQPDLNKQMDRVRRMSRRLYREGHSDAFVELMIQVYNGHDGAKGLVSQRHTAIRQRCRTLKTIIERERVVHARLHALVGVVADDVPRVVNAASSIYWIGFEGGASSLCDNLEQCDGTRALVAHARSIIELIRAQRQLEQADEALDRELQDPGVDRLYSKGAILELLHVELGFSHADIALLLNRELLRKGRPVANSVLDTAVRASISALSNYQRQIRREDP